MAPRNCKIISISIVLGILAWLSNALIDFYLNPNLPGLRNFFFDLPDHELYGRLLLLLCVSVTVAIALKTSCQHRKTKEALFEGQRLLENIFNSSQEGLIIKDRDLTILRFNPTAARWYDYAMPLLGRKCYEALRGREAICPGCPSQQALELGEPVQAILPKPGPGGREVGWLELYAAPVVDPATGEVSGVIESIRDITGHKEAEEALRRERDFSIAVLDTISSLVVVLDGEGRILRFNRACEKTTGYTADEIRGRYLWDLLLAPEELEGVKAVFQQLLSGHIPNEYENFWVAKGGRRRLISWSNTVLLDQQGQVEYVIATGIDITERRQAEEALREREGLYRLLVNNIPAVVFKGYLDWSIEFVDDKIEALTGYSKVEFNSGRLKWCDMILPEDFQGAQEVFRHALRTSKFYVREYRIRTRDGGIRWIQSRGQILCDLQKELEYVYGVFFDITEHKEAEEALRKSQAGLAEAQRLAQLGSWEWQIPSNEVLWSDEVYHVLGLNPGENKPSFEAYLKAVHPGDRALARRAFSDVLYHDRPYRIRHRIIKADGSERFVYAQGEIFYDDSGQPLRMMGTIQDITERKRYEEALTESERRYRLLAENVTDVIWTMDLQLNFTFVSPSIKWLSGYEARDYIKLPLERILAPASQEVVRNKLQEELSKAEDSRDPARAVTLELELFRQDGSTVWAEVKASLLRDDQGHPVGLLGVSRDITARRKLEAQLQQAQKMEVVGRLAGGVAHDFNNLLTAILGYTGLLLAGLNEGDPSYQELMEIRKAGERAGLLIRQLLAFSRRQVLRPISLDLNQVIENLAKMLKRVIGEDIQLEINYGADLGQVMADPGQIEQVVLNLTVNARDAMPRGGKLTVRTANVELDETYARSHAQVQPGPYVVLAVTDTGSGMDTATRDRIFEPFFTTKEMGKGTGLGLSTVYGIVHQSGGHIWVYSEPGLGATFKVYLPRVVAGAETALSEEGAEVSLQGQETILLVEDDDVVREITGRILRRSGYQVLEAREGNEALEISQSHQGPIHLVLSDLVMPGINGRELVLQIASQHPGIKVALMSGYAEEGIIDREILGTGIGFIEKPFEARVLLRKVWELLHTS